MTKKDLNNFINEIEKRTGLTYIEDEDVEEEDQVQCLKKISEVLSDCEETEKRIAKSLADIKEFIKNPPKGLAIYMPEGGLVQNSSFSGDHVHFIGYQVTITGCFIGNEGGPFLVTGNKCKND